MRSASALRCIMLICLLYIRNEKQDSDTIIQSFSKNDLIVATDGGCVPNPGPGGSGAVMFIDGKERYRRSAALGKHSTNNIAELYGILMALDFVDEYRNSMNSKTRKNGKDSKTEKNEKDEKNGKNEKSVKSYTVRILSDSTYAIGVLWQNWKVKANKDLIAYMKARLNAMSHSNVNIHYYKVPAHAGVEYNEIADKLSSEGVALSENGQDDYTKRFPSPSSYKSWVKQFSSIKKNPTSSQVSLFGSEVTTFPTSTSSTSSTSTTSSAPSASLARNQKSESLENKIHCDVKSCRLKVEYEIQTYDKRNFTLCKTHAMESESRFRMDGSHIRLLIVDDDMYDHNYDFGRL